MTDQSNPQIQNVKLKFTSNERIPNPTVAIKIFFWELPIQT